MTMFMSMNRLRKQLQHSNSCVRGSCGPGNVHFISVRQVSHLPTQLLYAVAAAAPPLIMTIIIIMY